MDDKVSEQILQIKKRIDRLEFAVFSDSYQKKAPKINENKKYAGPKGGILLLIKKGSLKTTHTASDIKKELEKEGYIYKIQVVQTALNRLSNSKGPLVKMDDKGRKSYVKRK